MGHDEIPQIRPLGILIQPRLRGRTANLAAAVFLLVAFGLFALGVAWTSPGAWAGFFGRLDPGPVPYLLGVVAILAGLFLFILSATKLVGTVLELLSRGAMSTNWVRYRRPEGYYPYSPHEKDRSERRREIHRAVFLGTLYYVGTGGLYLALLAASLVTAWIPLPNDAVLLALGALAMSFVCRAALFLKGPTASKEALAATLTPLTLLGLPFFFFGGVAVDPHPYFVPHALGALLLLAPLAAFGGDFLIEFMDGFGLLRKEITVANASEDDTRAEIRARRSGFRLVEAVMLPRGEWDQVIQANLEPSNRLVRLAIRCWCLEAVTVRDRLMAVKIAIGFEAQMKLMKDDIMRHKWVLPPALESWAILCSDARTSAEGWRILDAVMNAIPESDKESLLRNTLDGVIEDFGMAEGDAGALEGPKMMAVLAHGKMEPGGTPSADVFASIRARRKGA